MKIIRSEKINFTEEDIEILNKAIKMADDLVCDCETDEISCVANACLDALADLLKLGDEDFV